MPTAATIRTRTRTGLCGLALVLGAALAALLLALGQAGPARADDGEVFPEESIQDEIDAAPDGATILIHAGHYTEALTLSKPVSLTGVSSDTVFLYAVTGQRVLTITGAAVDSSVVISGPTILNGSRAGASTCPEGCGAGMLIAGGAQPRIENVTLYNNFAAHNGGGLYAGSGSPLVLVNVHVLSNTAGEGGGLYLDNNVTLLGGRIESNRTISLTGDGLTASGQVTITGTAFISNSAGTSGGGVYAGGPASVHNSLLQENSAVIADGGGLYANAALTLTHTSFISNTAMDRGGGAYSNGAVWVTGGYFEHNAALFGVGGGLRAGGGLTPTGAHFISNSAVNSGGGAAVGSAATITNAVFQENQTGNNGGGLFSTGTASLMHTDFISNTAPSGLGGGFFSPNGGSVFGGLFAGNLSGLSGGGQAVVGDLQTSGASFVNNQAGVDGGGAAAQNGAVWITNTVFAGNTAAENGHALRTNVSAPVQVVHATIVGSSPADGSALYFDNSGAMVTNTIITSHSVGLHGLGSIVTQDYNLFWSVTTPTSGSVSGGANNITGEPAFVAPEAGDYRLQRGSPAVNAGTDLGVTGDFEGESRPAGAAPDIGMDEYVNLAPVAAADEFGTSEDVPLVVAAPGVLANDYDLNGEAFTHTVEVVDAPGSGALDLAADGSFVYTPALNVEGVITFTYKVNNGELDSNPGVVTITITGVNDPPTISALGPLTGTVGQATSPIPFTVDDVETPAGDLDVTAEASNPVLLPPGSLVLGGSGTARTLTLLPAPGIEGTATITLTVTDADGGAAVSTFVFTVESRRLFLPAIVR